MQTIASVKLLLTVVCLLAAGGPVAPSAAQSSTVSLTPSTQLRAFNVKTEPVTYKGRSAIRVIDAELGKDLDDSARFAVIAGSEFSDGVIELEIAGDALPGTPPSIRGFTGLAFHVAPDYKKYEAFYLRPKNGRSEDQVQRNHSAQYISVPEFPWQRLRSEFPEKYESYVDLVAGEWTKMKIEVKGAKAKLFVHGSEQPTLLVNDLKHGAGQGGLALWIGPGVVAHFASLRVGQ